MTRGVIAFFLGMIVMACGACGRGGSASSTAATPEQAASAPVTASAPVVAATPKPVAVSTYGDSTMTGYEFINGAYIVTANNVQTDLEKLLTASLGPGITVTMQNQAGGSVLDTLNATNGVPVPFARSVLTDKGQIIDENFGIKDWGDGFPQFQQALTTFVTIAQSAGKKVVLEEPNPQCNKKTGESVVTGPNPLVTVINQVGAAYNVPVVHQYTLIMAIPGWCSMLTDQMHPNDQLYAIKAQNLADVIAPIVKAMQ